MQHTYGSGFYNRDILGRWVLTQFVKSVCRQKVSFIKKVFFVKNVPFVKQRCFSSKKVSFVKKGVFSSKKVSYVKKVSFAKNFNIYLFSVNKEIFIFPKNTFLTKDIFFDEINFCRPTYIPIYYTIYLPAYGALHPG